MRESSVKVYLNPPLPRAKGIKLLKFLGSKNRFYLFCDIVDGNQSHLSYEHKGSDVKLAPSDLFAMIPGEEYPYVPVLGGECLSNFNLSILNGDKVKPPVDNMPFHICLKIYH